MRNTPTILSIVIISVYILIAILTATGLLASSWQAEVGASYLAPSLKSFELIFGTDILGRSVLFKTLKSIEVSILIGFTTAIISSIIGIILGVISGYFGGLIDELITWIHTIVSSIPYIMLLIAITLILGKGQYALLLALGFTYWTGLCRLVRAEVIKHKNRDYVLAAHAIGVSHFAILSKHILPNIFHIIIINFSLTFQSAIKAEVILSYIGIGMQSVSLGLMIDDAKNELSQGIYWQLMAATIFMFIIVLAFNILGDSLRDYLDPKLKDRHG